MSVQNLLRIGCGPLIFLEDVYCVSETAALVYSLLLFFFSLSSKAVVMSYCTIVREYA